MNNTNNAGYRVNFGNGQVHYAGDRAACVRFIKDHGDAFTFLQFRQHGEWFKARLDERDLARV
jgi:hypothetical protein